MSGLAEIQEAIVHLAPQDRVQLRDWLHQMEDETSADLLTAVDEGIRSIETHGGILAEELRRQIASWAIR